MSSRSSCVVVPISLAASACLSASAFAACTNSTGGAPGFTPSSGQAITCTAAPPNPETTGIIAAAAANNITISVQNGAALSVATTPAVQLNAGSTLVNAGTLAAAGAGLPGVSLTGGGNALTNSGTITGATGLNAVGAGNTLTNTGAITGTSGPGVTMSGGNASITNSGTIAGSAGRAVVTGAGSDSYTMQGGTVTGSIDQGDGVDRFIIVSGRVAGSVIQGSGTDDFRMTGGTIQSLQQGDNRDTFFMSAGTIAGAFEDGDVAAMTGGTIGRVDMKLDNNIFEMSGGTIQGNLVTGFGNDTITISDGFIGGNVSVSGGTDLVTLTGGRIAGQVLMSTGDDTFTWSDGGRVDGLIDMGPGNDTALLRNLGAAQLATAARFSGGAGNDVLTLQNAQAAGIARFTQFETVNLQGSQFTMDGDLVLGDAATGTGTLNIDAASMLKAVPGAAASIAPAAAGGLATVNNAGTLDLTGGQAANRMTIVGNYNGQGGRLNIDSVLAADDAPSDRLIVSQGAIGGTSTLAVNNLGGTGAATARNGIMVVEAANGGTSSATAFSMRGTLKAGPYQYFLYKGGETAGSENNWYLRSTIPAVPSPTSPTSPTNPTNPTNPTSPTAPAATAPVAAPVEVIADDQTISLAPAPLPAAGPQAVPIYREEVPVYGAVSATSRQLAMFTLGTFHDRQGSQGLLTENGKLPAGWARVFGENTDRHYGGDTQSAFDGWIGGVQVGQDLYSARHENGGQDLLGLFLGYAHADGDVHGSTLGEKHASAGSMNLDGYSLGAYWTHVGPTQWYTDAVAMVTRLNADLRSHGGMDESTDGTATTLSLEGGYPIAVGPNWSLEPQAQFVAQFLSVDSLDDDISRVSFKDSDAYTGRIGFRLAGHYESEGRQWEPYLRANLWRNFSGTDKTVYDGSDALTTRYGSTALQLGAGVTAHVSRSVSLYASADYIKDVGGDYMRGVMGTIGMRIRW